MVLPVYCFYFMNIFLQERHMSTDTYQQVGRKCDRESLGRLVTQVLRVGQWDSVFHDEKFWEELNVFIESIDRVERSLNSTNH